MQEKITPKIIRDIFIIIIGTAIFCFGIVYFNIPNDLAEGGATGITLILRALFGIDPAISTLVINIPLILLGGRILGKQSFYYTILGTLGVSFWLSVWQRIPILIDLNHDLLLVSIIGGIIAGFGSGLIYRVGGTTGGTDILARIVEKNTGISVGRAQLMFDTFVLVLSLTYIDLSKMLYTLIYIYIFSRLVDSVVDGGYSAKGIIIVSEKSQQIAPLLIEELDRGLTYLKGEGGFSNEDKKIIYIVVTPREISTIKQIVDQIDPKAFINVLNVHEVQGEGFSYLRPKRKRHLK